MKKFGERDRLSLELSALEPSWERQGPFDSGPWSALSIYLGGRCLTRAVERGGEIVTSINIPLIPLASWLVENIRAIAYEECNAYFRSDVNLHEALVKWNNFEAPNQENPEAWENHRYEWYRRHFWLAGAEGCFLPDVALVKSDERLWMSWRTPEFAGPKQPEFIEAPGFDSIAWSSAFEVLCEFVSYVSLEARKRGLIDMPWISENNPLQKAAHCSANEFISLVAPEAQDLLNKLGIDSAKNPDESMGLQAMRDLEVKSDTQDEIQKALSELQVTSGRRAGGSNYLEELRRECLRPEGISPEQLGYNAAIWLRSKLTLNGEPIQNERLESEVEKIAELAELDANSLRNHSVMGLESGKEAKIVLLKHARMVHPWARRMELARAIAHLLLDPCTAHSVLGAGSSQAAQGPRRRRSGAFAAEFLLPRSGMIHFLKGRSPLDDRGFEQMMSEFQVGATTAAYHLWNQGLIQFVEDRDALIQEYRYPGSISCDRAD